MSTVCSFSTTPSSLTVHGRVFNALASMRLLVLNSQKLLWLRLYFLRRHLTIERESLIALGGIKRRRRIGVLRARPAGKSGERAACAKTGQNRAAINEKRLGRCAARRDLPALSSEVMHLLLPRDAYTAATRTWVAGALTSARAGRMLPPDWPAWGPRRTLPPLSGPIGLRIVSDSND